MRLDGQALGVHVRVGAQIERGIRGEQDRLEQVVDTRVVARGDVDEHRVAAVLLGHEAVLGELAADLLRLRLRLINLVHRDHDRQVRRLGVVDRLHRLRHHAVVRGDHQDGQVGRLGAAGTHGGKRLVARGIQEGDRALLTVQGDGGLVRADALGDAAGLAGTDVGVADRVQKAGLAVVDVTHDGHDRRALHQLVLVAGVLAELQVEGLEQLAVLVLRGDDLDVVVDFGAQQLQGLLRHGLGSRHHLAEVEQRLNQVRCVGTDLLGEVSQGRTLTQADSLAAAVGQAHAADDVRCVHLLVLVALLALGLASAAGSAAGTTERAGGAAAATAAPTETAACTRAAGAALTTATAAAARSALSSAPAGAGGRLGRHLGR